MTITAPDAVVAASEDAFRRLRDLRDRVMEGSATCTLQGFPGVDLKSKDGSVSAERSDLTPEKVSVKPGEEIRFTLTYPPWPLAWGLSLGVRPRPGRPTLDVGGADRRMGRGASP
ncbi:DUF4232 domain-containing protein [Streptomyces himastatinicus]|nr:DUF4232 domain-containing protein [Streptomyces himastatinicus]